MDCWNFVFLQYNILEVLGTYFSKAIWLKDGVMTLSWQDVSSKDWVYTLFSVLQMFFGKSVRRLLGIRDTMPPPGAKYGNWTLGETWIQVSIMKSELQKRTINRFSIQHCRYYSGLQDFIHRDRHDILGKNHKVCSFPGHQWPQSRLGKRGVSWVDSHPFRIHKVNTQSMTKSWSYLWVLPVWLSAVPGTCDDRA